MAKLSKMEITAIANKIVEDVRKQIKEENEKLTSKEKFTEWLKVFKTTSKYKSILAVNKAKEDFNKEFKNTQLKNKYGSVCPIDTKLINIENFCEEVFRFEAKEKTSNIYSGIVERDIIIAQAKNEDLDALITSLTEKYSK